MSLAIIVTLFQCSGLKATEMQHHHDQSGSDFPKKEVTLEVLVHGNIPFLH